ncbi:iron-sulfur cluster biosynthesis protein [Umezawaea sp.]|uniref:iron-sulfur cluster biosynthesis protein n=1 Tax=Umezawaea sp. TaxID=1955258 RepID=UPI002ED51702
MLAIDDTAKAAITTLTNAMDVSERGGLRIAARSGDGRYDLSIAPQPGDGELVVTSEPGAAVFLDPVAARLLADKVLNVRADEAGHFHFGVYPQD